MSASKRKLSPTVKEIYDNIQETTIGIKLKLKDSKRSEWGSIRTELQHLASLAESFTKQRPRSNKDWVDLADSLDRDGVDLWNTSARIQEGGGDENRGVAVFLRLAGFRLIEAGLQQKPAIEILIYVLELASKAGSGLSAIGSQDLAASVLASAAKYEESLRKAEDPEELFTQSRARAVVVYFSSRMEAAWKEGNDAVADFMLQKITENNYFTLLQPRDRELLAAKLLEIGKSLLRVDQQGSSLASRGARARDSVKWLQKAFAMIECLDDANNMCEKDLKRSILRSLARAYYISSPEDPENLIRAEASLNELISSIDTSSDHTSNEFQQLRWMRIAVLKKRKAAQPLLLDAFRSVVDHMALTENDITDVLQELRSFGQEHVLVTAIHKHCLERCLHAGDQLPQSCIDRLLLSFLFYCSKDVDHSRTMQNLADFFACLNSARFELSRISATACVTLLWQFGDRQYQSKRWSEAADWFHAATHQTFGSIAALSDSKCLRKAALCHIQQSDYAKAAAVIRRCSSDEAATHYVRLLTAVHQGLEDEAIGAVRAMVNASDFSRKMLLLATRLANESEMNRLLLSVLEALLETVRTGDGAELDVEAVALARCIIRLTLKLMAEPGSHQTHLIPVLIKHFHTAVTLIANFKTQKDVTVVSRDISWLWRTAYNSAIQGCSEWQDSEESVADLFDIARQLLEYYRDSVVTEIDTDIYTHLINASFATVAGRVFAGRKKAASSQGVEYESLQKQLEGVASCKERIGGVINSRKLSDDQEVTRAQALLHTLHVFEVEILCQLKAWDRLLHTIERVIGSDALAVNTFEAITDILWVDKDCPIDVLFAALEAILHASLDRSSLSIAKFSRWLRAICSMLLSRNTATDRTKAIGYVEQAIHVLDSHASQTAESEEYPLDERQWLLGTAYNTGIECLHASLLDEAKRWFEASTTICRFVPDGATRAERISETYSRLLERYTQYSAAHSTESA